MKLGVVIYSDDIETIFNALRIANLALAKGDQVKLFLLGRAVVGERFYKAFGVFDVSEQIQAFVERGGEMFASDVCLKLHGAETREFCPASTMDDLYRLIAESDKVLTF